MKNGLNKKEWEMKFCVLILIIFAMESKGESWSTTLLSAKMFSPSAFHLVIVCIIRPHDATFSLFLPFLEENNKT